MKSTKKEPACSGCQTLNSKSVFAILADAYKFLTYTRSAMRCHSVHSPASFESSALYDLYEEGFRRV